MMHLVRLSLVMIYLFYCVVPFSWSGPSEMIPDLYAQKESTGRSNTLPATPITNEHEMTFVYLNHGEFRMGSPLDEGGRQANESPHRVVLSQGFYMMTTEVTQQQWMNVMGQNPSAFDDCGPDCPVENISWSMAQRFIDKLNGQNKDNSGLQLGNTGATDSKNKSKKIGSRPSVKYRYVLPTEAQWEYACRAGSRGWFYFGGDTWRLSEYAWYKNNAGGKPHAVAQKKPNAFGLYDIHGNVWEWCQDYAGSYSPKKGTDPIGPAKGTLRMARGGSWYYQALAARCANRLALPPEMGNYNVGLRLVLVAE